jgi:hypothetical protein
MWNVINVPLYAIDTGCNTCLGLRMGTDQERTDQHYISRSGGQIRRGQIRRGQIRRGQIRRGQIRRGQISTILAGLEDRSGEDRLGEDRLGTMPGDAPVASTPPGRRKPGG